MSKQLRRLVERAAALFAALALGSGITIFQLLTPAITHAFPTGLQVQNRAIYMSNSTPNVNNQSYLVTFKPGSTTAIKGVIVDFCSTSPIIGDTCTVPTAFTVGTPTVNTSSVTAGTNSPVSATGLPGGAWTAASLNSGRTLKLTNASGSGALSTSTLYDFYITTVHNPSTTGTFYARIITYTSDTGDIASYTDSTPGSTDALDYGGFALSTAANITVTAKVQEALTFCTSGPVDASHLTASPLDGTNTGIGGGTSCAAATTPSITLGHGAPAPGVLDNTAVDANPAFTQASTNATNGLALRMHAQNSCANAGLSTNGGSTCNITGLDNTTATGAPGTVAAGTTFFGLFVKASSTTTGVSTSSGTITPDGNYNDGTNTNTAAPATVHYGMDNTVNSGVLSTYGDLIASSTGPVSQINNELWYAATASLTVPAGIYTGQESIIATGTF